MVLVRSFLGGKFFSCIAAGMEGDARHVEVIEMLLGKYLMEARCSVQVEVMGIQCFASGNYGCIGGLVL